jgi:hypothetical protein
METTTKTKPAGLWQAQDGQPGNPHVEAASRARIDRASEGDEETLTSETTRMRERFQCCRRA